MTHDALANRLHKNLKRLRPWLVRQGISCFRAYDRDLPDVPLALDVYATEEDGTHVCVHVFEPRHGIERARLEAWLASSAEALSVTPARVHLKRRVPGGVHPKTGDAPLRTVREANLRFLVNLDDYLDTGLFLDHRHTRLKVQRESAGRRMLNLFAYTGAFTVHAAAGGARETVSVDLSPTYARWASDNLRLNGHGVAAHEVVVDDVMEWVARAAGSSASSARARAGGGRQLRRFDLAVIDPPTLSRSKRAAQFEVQRDHVQLIAQVLEIMEPGGVVYFSTNFQGFTLGDLGARVVDEITEDTVPFDFPRRPSIHRAWRAQK